MNLSLGIHTLAAAGSEPAGGAALGEVVLASSAALVVTAGLLVLGMGHRSGRVRLLGRLAAFAERMLGLPGWVALPSAVATTSLVTAVVGMYWDIALHIDVGRDPGPLANPAHYLILAGLFGILSAGFFAIVLPTEEDRLGAAAIRIAPGWHAPLGGVLMFGCGAFSLIGFPLDDVWHRLFGQDVTLWGPTHLMLIGGAAMTLVGIGALLVEGIRANRARRVAAGRRPGRPSVPFILAVPLCGGFLLGLSTFQGEFDFGVPQFRFVFQPLLIMLAASVALVASRMFAGRGGAVGAVAFFLAVRGALAIAVGPVLGETTPHMPLYLVEALVVEVVALRVPRGRPLAFGLWSGLGIGTLGLAAEWGWSHVWMPLPWPATMLPEAAALGCATAIAGGVLGAWIGTRLEVEPRPRPAALRTGAVIGAAAIAAIVAFALVRPAGEPASATVALTDVRGGPQRSVGATVQLDPPNAARDADWLTATAWQGGGLVVDRLKRTGPGTYRTTRPIPVHGDWKAMIRMERGGSLDAIPLFLPRDRAIPAAEVPARARFTRSFVSDRRLLQREQKASSPALTGLAYAVVGGIALTLLAFLAWGLHRLATAGVEPAAERRRGTGGLRSRPLRTARLGPPV